MVWAISSLTEKEAKGNLWSRNQWRSMSKNFGQFLTDTIVLRWNSGTTGQS
ncbi:unnamed protein product [Prunus brigantina]